MRNFLFLVALLPTLLFAQRSDVFIDGGIFQVNYSEIYQQPTKIKYRIECPNGTASRKGMDFYKEDGIKTSDHKDYEENVWDKGHMAPAAHFNCTRDMLFETFTYMNCALQHQSLNRGVWKHLESRERELAKQNSFVEVTIRVEFDKSPGRVPTNAAIPRGFYKELKFGGVKACYYFPNVSPIYTNYKDYKCKCR